MLRNPKYVYGSRDLYVPSHLHFGEYMLEKLWKFKDKVALIDAITSNQITYGEMLQQSMNFAISLAHIGVRKGDVIAIFSENRIEYWSALIGAVCAGATVTTLSTSYVEHELKHVFNISKPKYIICSNYTYQHHKKTIHESKFIKQIFSFGKVPNTLSYDELINIKNNVNYSEFECVKVDGVNDVLFIIYSSGTTGLPKGVMLTHLNCIVCCCMPASIDPNVLTIGINPWYHAMGLVGGASALALGRTGIYLAKFDVDIYLKTIEKYQITNLAVVPPVLVAVCKTKNNYDLTSVKVIYSGAAPLHKETVQAVYDKFPNLEAVLQGYGLSETSLAVTRFSHENRHMGRIKMGSVGLVTPGFIIKIIDINTKEVLGPNQQGEICVKGQALMKGYIGVDSDFDNEGFYRTGDVGYYDDDKYFYISDRIKELIKYKGFQVPPAELEALLLTHPKINDVGVIGIPDQSAGEVPLAFVVIQPGQNVDEKEIIDFVAQRVSNPKHLRGGVRFIDKIPKSVSGKILRKELRKMITNKKSKL